MRACVQTPNQRDLRIHVANFITLRLNPTCLDVDQRGGPGSARTRTHTHTQRVTDQSRMRPDPTFPPQ